eukprot:scaffold17205_cov186-Amphora_coffeaeformis.AAC.3
MSSGSWLLILIPKDLAIGLIIACENGDCRLYIKAISPTKVSSIFWTERLRAPLLPKQQHRPKV